LSCRLRRHLLLSGRIEARLGEIIAQAKRTIFGNLCERLAQLFVGKRTAFAEEFGEIFEDAFRCLNVFRVAVDRHVLAARINANVEQRFQILDVLIVNTKERF
jgi:hypothetical protein